MTRVIFICELVHINRFWCVPIRLNFVFKPRYRFGIDRIPTLGIVDRIAVEIGQSDTVSILNTKITLVSEDEPGDGNDSEDLMAELC